jgi:hypothetical protein
MSGVWVVLCGDRVVVSGVWVVLCGVWVVVSGVWVVVSGVWVKPHHHGQIRASGSVVYSRLSHFSSAVPPLTLIHTLI